MISTETLPLSFCHKAKKAKMHQTSGIILNFNRLKREIIYSNITTLVGMKEFGKVQCQNKNKTFRK